MVEQVFPASTQIPPIAPVALQPTVLATAPKPGWKTTEFWGHAAAALLTLLFASGLLTNNTALNVAGIATAWLGSLGYTVNRTLLKQGAGALLLIGLLAAPQVACSSSSKQREVAGVGTFLGCEAGQFPAGTLSDATKLAISVVTSLIDPTGKPDTSALKADAAPLKTSLLRCAWDAAIAALAGPAPSLQPGAPAAAPMPVDRAALASAWAGVRAELAWPTPAAP